MLVHGIIMCECGSSFNSDHTYAGMGYITCPRCRSAIPLELVPLGANDCALLRKIDKNGKSVEFIRPRAIPNRIYA